MDIQNMQKYIMRPNIKDNTYMIFKEIRQLNLNVDDAVIDENGNISIITHIGNDDAEYYYATDEISYYTKFGLWSVYVEQSLTNSVSRNRFYFKRLLCNKLERIIPA